MGICGSSPLKSLGLGVSDCSLHFEENLGMPEGELKEVITGAWMVET